MELREVMTPDVECVSPDTTIRDAANRMKTRDIGDVLVCDNDRLTGVITDRDIVLRIICEGKDSAKATVKDAMSRNLAYCFEDQSHEEAAQLMCEKQIRRLPILNRDKRLAGIVSLGDLALETHDETVVEKTLEAVCEPVGAM